MRKVIATINTTLDAVWDHSAGIPDEEYTSILRRFIKQCQCDSFWQDNVSAYGILAKFG